MNTGGDAAEQIVRMSLEGFEVAAKITGAGSKNIAVLLYSILKEERKTMGKARLSSMLRSGKELKVFTVKQEDLAKFTKEAKKYGVLYCVLADRKNKSPHAEIDVISRAEDAPKISRIVERFNLASVDTAKIVTEAEKVKTEKNNIPAPELSNRKDLEKEKLMESLLGKTVKKEENTMNPFFAKTEKSPPSKNISKKQRNTEGESSNRSKPSVKKQLEEIREERKEKSFDLAKDKMPSNSKQNGKTAKDKISKKSVKEKGR